MATAMRTSLQNKSSHVFLRKKIIILLIELVRNSEAKLWQPLSIGFQRPPKDNIKQIC